MGSKKYEIDFLPKYLGLLDLHKEFPSLKLPLDFILIKCDLIMPRYYTIASSSLAHPKNLAIAISLTKLPQGDKFKDGLTSGYYEDMQTSFKGVTSKCFVKDSQFRMPDSMETPIIMVGPGTGIVPYIGFLQER